MEISNDDLARMLGRMEAKIDAQAQSSIRMETALSNLDQKLTSRLDGHECRLRDLEIANPKLIAETVAAHAKRIQALENGSAKTAALAGVGSAICIAAIVEFVKSKLGL